MKFDKKEIRTIVAALNDATTFYREQMALCTAPDEDSLRTMYENAAGASKSLALKITDQID